MPTPLRVLLVEDSLSDVLLLREALARSGDTRFVVRHAEFLRDALAYLACPEAAPAGVREVAVTTHAGPADADVRAPAGADVALLDLGLPDSEGLDTFLELRRQAPALPVVVLTGLVDEALGMKAVRAGAQDYLVKGQVDGRVLARAIRYAVERCRAEEMLRQYAERLEILSRRLLDAQEAERGRLARELHDEIGQVLTAVKINVQALRPHVAPAGQPRLEESIDVVNRAIQQVRDLSLDLRPSLLDDLGLAAAVRWYTDRQAQRAGLIIHTTAEALPARLPNDVETVCFRVMQEALTNVVRHGRARQVHVMLSRANGGLCLSVRDDGVGFDPAAQARAAPGHGLGLLGMRERVHLAGGKLEIVSAPGRGTEIIARLPLASAAPPQA